MIKLDPKTTALVLIDLQKGIVTPERQPYAGDIIVSRAKQLADKFRNAKAHVVLVHVTWSADGGEVLKQKVDKQRPAPQGNATEWSRLVDGLQQPGDIIIAKHNWGAFFGTDLDVQLRRRGIRTIVLGGIATNMGVESTARQAYEHNYEIVIVENICSSISREAHEFSFNTIFPMISRVAKSADIELN